MALVFMDGFDHYDIADIGDKWTSVSSPANCTKTMDAGRIAGQSLKAVQSTGGGTMCLLTRAYTAQGTTGGVGFAFKTNSLSAGIIGEVYTSITSRDCLRLYIGADGVLTIKRLDAGTTEVILGTGGNVSVGNWVYIEWKWVLHLSSGSTYVNVNGLNAITASGVATASATSGAAFTSVIVGGGGSGIRTVWWDDIYMFDGNTGVTDFLGDVTVLPKLVTANGTTNNGVASAGSNYQCVDESLASTTDYVTLDAVDEIDTYVVEDVEVGSAIKAVQVSVMVQKSTDGAAGLVSVIRHSGTDYVHSTPKGLNASYEIKTFMYETDPTGAAWTDSVFNAAEFGVKKTL